MEAVQKIFGTVVTFCAALYNTPWEWMLSYPKTTLTVMFILWMLIIWNEVRYHLIPRLNKSTESLRETLTKRYLKED